MSGDGTVRRPTDREMFELATAQCWQARGFDDPFFRNCTAFKADKPLVLAAMARRGLNLEVVAPAL